MAALHFLRCISSTQGVFGSIERSQHLNFRIDGKESFRKIRRATLCCRPHMTLAVFTRNIRSRIFYYPLASTMRNNREVGRARHERQPAERPAHCAELARQMNSGRRKNE